MKYTPYRMDDFLHGGDARRITTLAAGRILARARALAPVDTGETKASGRIVHGRTEDGSRVMPAVEFGGAAVQLEFGRQGNRPLSRAVREVSDGWLQGIR